MMLHLFGKYQPLLRFERQCKNRKLRDKSYDCRHRHGKEVYRISDSQMSSEAQTRQQLQTSQIAKLPKYAINEQRKHVNFVPNCMLTFHAMSVTWRFGTSHHPTKKYLPIIAGIRVIDTIILIYIIDIEIALQSFHLHFLHSSNNDDDDDVISIIKRFMWKWFRFILAVDRIVFSTIQCPELSKYTAASIESQKYIAHQLNWTDEHEFGVSIFDFRRVIPSIKSKPNVNNNLHEYKKIISQWNFRSRSFFHIADCDAIE